MILIHQKFWKNTIPVAWLDMINKDVLFGLYPLDPWTLKGYFIQPKRLTLFVTPSSVCKNRKKIWGVNLKRCENNECLLPSYLSFDLKLVHFLSWKFHFEQWLFLRHRMCLNHQLSFLPLLTLIFLWHTFSSLHLFVPHFMFIVPFSLSRSHLETCFVHF